MPFPNLIKNSRFTAIDESALITYICGARNLAKMKNTTKLKHILQLYTVSMDMDEEGQFHLSLFSKHKSGTVTFVDKKYTTVVGKAFSHMIKVLKSGG